jgi:hypothetical protein
MTLIKRIGNACSRVIVRPSARIAATYASKVYLSYYYVHDNLLESAVAFQNPISHIIDSEPIMLGDMQ